MQSSTIIASKTCRAIKTSCIIQACTLNPSMYQLWGSLVTIRYLRARSNDTLLTPKTLKWNESLQCNLWFFGTTQ